MKYIKPMDAQEFADYLCTLETGDTIEFGTDPGCSWPDEIPESTDISNWYFARVMEISEYNSRFILIDYAGGEEAFAIPLNNYQNCCDADDCRIVHKYVIKYFKNHRDLCGAYDYVFVEMEEK